MRVPVHRLYVSVPNERVAQRQPRNRGDTPVENEHTYTIILTRAGTTAWALVGSPLRATSLTDARRIAGRFCPINGAAHIYEHEQAGHEGVRVAVVNQREMM